MRQLLLILLISHRLSAAPTDAPTVFLSSANSFDKFCGQFTADCYGCVDTDGECYYCPDEGTCYSERSDYGVCGAAKEKYLTDTDGKEACIGAGAFYKDPLYAGSKWAFDMIDLEEVWETYGLSGKGITIRINDSGVYVENKELEGRFDDSDNSCTDYLPTDSSHGTKVAGIMLGNADNDLCGVGIANQAKYSSCNIFPSNSPFISHKVQTFDISQNSWGVNPCKIMDFGRSDTKVECPFTYKEGDVCSECAADFNGNKNNESKSPACIRAIQNHCSYFYKEEEACSDFLELILVKDEETGDYCNYDLISSFALVALKVAIDYGRGGKGIIFVFSSGNEFEAGFDVNMAGYTISRYTIAVGAVGKDGFHAHYSSPGALVFVSAPAGDYKDQGHLMTTGIGDEKCDDSGTGTSFSAPVVSGVIALMLEANPDLSWRDVQGILAATSTTVMQDDEDKTQTINAVGTWHSNWYGFGIVNALRAVEASMEWDLYSEELQLIRMSIDEDEELSDDEGNMFTSTIEVEKPADGYFIVESTAILVSLSHYNRGDLEIKLESPSGTVSVLHPGKIPQVNQLEGDQNWKLVTVKNWGEDPTGQWKLHIRDLVERSEDNDENNVFRNWQLVVYGRESKDPPATKKPTSIPTPRPSTTRPSTNRPSPTARPSTNRPSPTARPSPTVRPTSSTTRSRV